MFFGFDVFSGKFSMLPYPVNAGTLFDVELRDGTYDRLYLSSDPEKTASDVYDDWEFSTKINADYETSLDGGNTGFSLKNTDTIIIKQREKGTIDWITIFTIPVNKLDDFNFIKEYNYGKSGVWYDFLIISSVGGIQNSYVMADCFCNFDGLCLTDKNTFYKTEFNIEPIEFKRNTGNTILHMLNDTYPVIISNDSTSYDSGSVSACFLKIDGCDIKTGYKAVKYREEILNWLTNKNAKILKLENGKLKLIQVVGEPSETYEGHPELQMIRFDFVEIGNADREEDLYQNNLSDIEPGRW